MKKVKSKYVHYWPELRSKHLNSASMQSGSLFLVQKYKTDFDVTKIPANAQIRSAGVWKSIFIIFKARPEVVEIPEPLYYRYLLKTVLLVSAISLLSKFRKCPPKFVTFCLENGDKGLMPRRLSYISSIIWVAAITPLVRYLVQKLDKVAFGSELAQNTLKTWLTKNQIVDLDSKSRYFPQLPSKCECHPELKKVEGSVLFIGELEARKGIPLLIQAWEEHSKEFKNSTLTIAGSGSLKSAVDQLALRNNNVNFLGQVNRDTVHKLMRTNQIVVLPSRRSGSWREQIGLPIEEGLAHSCSLIASEDSGLSNFLIENKQQVLKWDFSLEELVVALRSSTLNPVVVSSEKLPTRNQRGVAEDWLLSKSDFDE